MIKLAFNRENVKYNTLFENTLQIADVYALGNNDAIIEVVDKGELDPKATYLGYLKHLV